MPAPVVDGIVTYLASQLNLVVWDWEIPRYDTQGNPINLDAGATPVRALIREPGFSTEWTTEDTYYDEGEVTVQVWGTTRAALEDPNTGLLNKIEQSLCRESAYTAIAAAMAGGTLTEGPYNIVKVFRTGWWTGMEENERTAQSGLLYRGDLRVVFGFNGAFSTR